MIFSDVTFIKSIYRFIFSVASAGWCSVELTAL